MCCKMVRNSFEIWKILWELASRWAEFGEILSHSVGYGIYALTPNQEFCTPMFYFFWLQLFEKFLLNYVVKLTTFSGRWLFYSNFQNPSETSVCGCATDLSVGWAHKPFYRFGYALTQISKDMTKPTKWVCAQQQHRSAWASAQSDQSLRCAFNG